MDALLVMLDHLKKGKKVEGRFLGLIHVLIGRRITAPDGRLVSAGLSWRALAGWLKKIRWDPDAVRELGINPKDLPPRDRLRYWFVAISHAQVDSSAALDAGDRVAEILRDQSYVVGPAPKR